MKKIIKLTETELNRIIRKVISEQTYRTGNLDNPEDFLPTNKPEPKFKTPGLSMPAAPQFKPNLSPEANTSKGFVAKTPTKTFGVLKGDQNPTKTVGVLSPDLRQGSRGPEVIKYQKALSGLGYGTKPDGIFGPITHTAVLNFQSANKLPTTGKIDPKTGALITQKSTAKQTTNRLTNPLAGIKAGEKGPVPVTNKTTPPTNTGKYRGGMAGMY